MKKSLIALAVAGTFAAPAFAATANVDVYGKLHMAVSFVDDATVDPEGTVIPTYKQSGVQFTSNASRIGFKGTEDLGGGLKALWQIESSVNLDEQSGTLAGRNSFVGLGGGFGTVLLGNHDTPLKLVGRAVDLFGDTQGDSRNILGLGADTRSKNTIAYISPDMSGFSLAAAYSNDVTTGVSATVDGIAVSTADVEDKSLWNLAVNYSNGPIYVGASYADGDYFDNYLGEDTSHWRVAGSYAFGAFKVVAQYDNVEDLWDGWMVGGAYAMGPMTFKLNYAKLEEDGSNAEVSQWNLGVDYALSKRTSVYAMYTDANGKNGGMTALGFGAGASDMVIPDIGANDDDVAGFALGVVHTF